MSPVAASIPSNSKQQSTKLPFEPIMIALLAAGCAGAWWTLVVRQEAMAAAKEQEVDSLEAQVAAAKKYLQARPADEASKKEIAASAERLRNKIPQGHADGKIRNDLKRYAYEAELGDLEVGFPRGEVFDPNIVEKPPEERLALEPDKLAFQEIKVAFTGYYPDVLRFQRLVAASPWLLDMTEFSVFKDREDDRDRPLRGTMTLRYFYQ